MLGPIRPELKAAFAISEDTYTIREAIVWFKRVYRQGKLYDVLAENEQAAMNQAFAEVVRRTDKQYKLPEGPLGQFISSVALQEMILEEAEAAQA